MAQLNEKEMQLAALISTKEQMILNIQNTRKKYWVIFGLVGAGCSELANMSVVSGAFASKRKCSASPKKLLSLQSSFHK